jgi:phosphomethylpyrimidine synthase
MRFARNGEITPPMQLVAERESLAPELIRDEVARGRLVIPANVHHLAGALEPMAIGKVASVKVNANIGNSAVSSSIDEEVNKLLLAVKYGADTVMDLSTGKDIDITREAIIGASTVPIGTVPIYQAVLQGKELEELTINDFLEVIEHQARQGVDYMTLHAGILLQHLPLVYGRITGIVSRGGSLHAVWMMHHRKPDQREAYLAALSEATVGVLEAPRMKVMSDFCAEQYWTVVSEMEVPDLGTFEKMMSNPQGSAEDMKKFEEIMTGYHDLVDHEKREIYKIEG